MTTGIRFLATVLPVFAIGIPFCCADPLASWNDTAPKKAIIDFVERVTKNGSPDFVKPEDRLENHFPTSKMIVI
jgi:hypothetical protein